MNIMYVHIGRLFLGICLMGIGVLHLFFPGIRPIIIPGTTHISSQLYWIVYVTAFLLTGSGLLICINKKTTAVSLIIGIAFFILFLFFHMPSFLSATRNDKLEHWVNLNKTLALSGGFFVLASVNAKRSTVTKFNSVVSKFLVPGRYCFAIMLFLFGLGHFLSTASISTLVPAYIPFAKFWTFVGGIILMGSAISFFINFKIYQIALVLAVTLFIWLVTLHLYYAVLSPAWQEGENFIGLFTCMAFCGTALLIAQGSKINPVKTINI